MWAARLGKDERTIRRYAQEGILPDAYQTSGGQWRAPFTPVALEQVAARIKPWTRQRPRYFCGPELKRFTKKSEWVATRLVIAFALRLAIKRKPLDELLLTRVFRWFYSHPNTSARLFRTSLQRQICQVRHDFKEAALLAACAHALITLMSSTKAEAAEEGKRIRFNPFDLAVQGEVNGEVWSARGERRCPASAIIEKWQIIRGKRPAGAPKLGIDKDGLEFIASPKKMFSARTYYSWYPSKEERGKAMQNAYLLLEQGGGKGHHVFRLNAVCRECRCIIPLYRGPEEILCLDCQDEPEESA